jgi:hypothetical protein
VFKIRRPIKFNFKWFVVIVLAVIIDLHLNQERWLKCAVIDYDMANYYSYLPAFFYEKDLSLSFLNDTNNIKVENRYYRPNKTPEGHPVIKMSMGMAISYLPFFGLAHVYASLFEGNASGFSPPYHFAVMISSLFYFIFGLIFLNKVLKFYFEENIRLIVLTCLVFGTNVLYYLTIGAGMSHAFNFALVSAFLYFAIRWHQQKILKYALLLGLVSGFLVLVRPVNILLFVFLFLYSLRVTKGLKLKPNEIFKASLHFVLMAVVVVLICLPQLFYWRDVSGHYILNSYMNEHFYFLRPHLVEALFGFRKGWLIYTPIMIFAVLGFFFMRKKLNVFMPGLAIFFILYLYVVFSWWCWWYGGSFGQRALIDIYPLMALPMAAFFDAIQTQTKLKRQLIYGSVTMLVLLNLFQTIQANYNVIHYDSMTRAAYFTDFFSITNTAERQKHLKHPNYENALKGDDEF